MADPYVMTRTEAKAWAELALLGAHREERDGVITVTPTPEARIAAAEFYRRCAFDAEHPRG